MMRPDSAGHLAEHGWIMENPASAARTGIMPDGDAFDGAMGEVVGDGTAFLADEDLAEAALCLLDKDDTG